MGVNASIEGSNPSFSASRTERCPSGLRSATGNRVRAERCVAGSNPALSALGGGPARRPGLLQPEARQRRSSGFENALERRSRAFVTEKEGFEPSRQTFIHLTP